MNDWEVVRDLRLAYLRCRLYRRLYWACGAVVAVCVAWLLIGGLR